MMLKVTSTVLTAAQSNASRMNASSQPQLRRMRARTQNLVAVISTQIPNSGQETAWRIQPRSAPDASAIIKNCGAGHGGRSSVGVKIKGLGEGQVGGEVGRCRRRKSRCHRHPGQRLTSLHDLRRSCRQKMSLLSKILLSSGAMTCIVSLPL